MPQPGKPEFDIWEGAPENIANLRGKALVRMREIAQANEPEVLRYLSVGREKPATYAMTSGLQCSRKPEVRAKLTRVFVEEKLAEGDHEGAVSGLQYAFAARLPLNEYDEPFVAKQYDLSLEKGRIMDAHYIAAVMVYDGDNMVKIEPEVREHMLLAWRARELRAFGLVAEEVLTRPNITGWDVDRGYPNLHSLFNDLVFRQNNESNLYSEVPSELSKRIVEKVIQFDLQAKGFEWMAISHAAEAGMPADYIAHLMSQLDPTAIDKARNWWNRFRLKMENIFPLE